MRAASQRSASSWAVSVAAHALLLGALTFTLEETLLEKPQDLSSLIYVEPAPPPPPPAPGPAAGGQIAEPAPIMDMPPMPTRLVEPKKEPIKKEPPKPKPIPPKVATPPKPVLPASPPAGEEGVAGGMAGGETGGVVGGTVGGKVGGVVGGHGDQVVSANQVARPPAVLSRVMPAYPSLARTRGIEGQVLLQAIVDREGHVEQDVIVLRSIPLLDDAAVTALRKWHFRPGQDADGRLVRVQVEVPMRFQLR